MNAATIAITVIQSPRRARVHCYQHDTVNYWLDVLLAISLGIILYCAPKLWHAYQHPSLPRTMQACSDTQGCVVYSLVDYSFPPLSGQYGQIDQPHHALLIHAKQQGREHAKTLVHESMHAELVAHNWSVLRQNDEAFRLTAHEWIYLTEEDIVQLIHDNPELTRYIQKAW